eukprot:TRINITY_DN17999_c0_g1_i1.p1 TRINITY_DN17999_c0_g1~~TRINITY_DN17999_c0_g1_i1.p1  ORF type:complete len:953 (+),score=145.22 TRINITY_DN17999_c0_g1_i1:49-2907(+)
MEYSLKGVVISFALIAIWTVVTVAIAISIVSSKEIRDEMENAEVRIMTSCFDHGEKLLRDSMDSQYQQISDRGSEKVTTQTEPVPSVHYSTLSAAEASSDWKSYMSEYSTTIFEHEPTLLLHAWWSFQQNLSYAGFRHKAHSDVIKLYNNGSLSRDLLYEERNGVTSIVYAHTYPLVSQLATEGRYSDPDVTAWIRTNDKHTLFSSFSHGGTVTGSALATSFSSKSIDISSITDGMSDDDHLHIAITNLEGDIVEAINHESSEPVLAGALSQIQSVSNGSNSLLNTVCQGNSTSVTVDGRVLLVFGQHVKQARPNFEPLQWCVIVAANESYVASLFSDAKVEATAVIEESSDNADKDAITWITILIGVTVGFAIIVSAFSAYGANYVTKPLHILRSDMDQVSNLRLEGGFKDLPRSTFREIASMQASFSALYYAVAEFKQYMPQAVIERGSDSELIESHHLPSSSSSESDSENEGLPPAVSSGHQRVRPIISSTDSFTVSNDQSNRSTLLGESSTFEALSPQFGQGLSDKDENPSGSLSSKIAPPEPKTPNSGGLTKIDRYKTEDLQASGDSLKKRGTLAVYLQRRKGISHVSLSCKDFDEYMRQLPDPSLVVEFHSKWLGCCVTDAKVHGGVVERFIGDCVDINFGGLQSCINSANKATTYAVKVRDRIFTAKNRQCEGFNFPETFLCCGIASGSGFVGNLGHTGLKTPAVVGRAVMYSKAMLCVSRETGMDIIVDQRCADDLKGIYKSVPVDIIRYSEGSKKQVCSYVLGAHNATAGEWMYVVDAQTETAYEKAWASLRRSDNIPSVVSVVDAMFAIQDDPLARIVGSRIKSYLDEVILLTGKPPKDYYRVFRSKGCTVIVPENVRRASAKHTHKSGLSRNRGTAGSMSSFSSSQPVSFARASDVSAGSTHSTTGAIIKADSLKERPSNKTLSSPAAGSDLMSRSTSTSG